MKWIIFLTSLFSYVAAWGQRYEKTPDKADLAYAMDYNESISWELYLYNNSKQYTMVITTSGGSDPMCGGPDIIISNLFSSGHLKRTGDAIVFTDMSTGFSMDACFNDQILIFTKSYPPLMEKSFTASPYLDVLWAYIINKRDLNELRSLQLNNSSIRPYTLRGTYSAGEFMDILLRHDKTFEYKYNSLLMLKGYWSQKGNLITLHDEHTGHDFYLIYEYPNLRTMLLPGDVYIYGTVLKPQ